MVAFQFYLIDQHIELYVGNLSHGSHLQYNSATHSELCDSLQCDICVSIIPIQNFNFT